MWWGPQTLTIMSFFRNLPLPSNLDSSPTPVSGQMTLPVTPWRRKGLPLILFGMSPPPFFPGGSLTASTPDTALQSGLCSGLFPKCAHSPAHPPVAPSGAVLTKYHKLPLEDNRDLLFQSSGGWRSEVKVPAGPCAPRRL